MQGYTVEISFLHCCTPIILPNSASPVKSEGLLRMTLQEVVRMPERSMRTGPQMLGWQRPARRSGRLSDSRVYRTYGTKESRKEGRSS